MGSRLKLPEGKAITVLKNAVRTLIFDETCEVVDRARSVFGSADMPLTFAESLPELDRALNAFESPELVIVNLSADVGGWTLAEHLRRIAPDARIVILADNLTDPRMDTLRAAARVDFVLRPSGSAFDEVLSRLLGAAPASRVSPGATTTPSRVEPPAFHGIIGRSREMLRIYSLIEKVAPGDANVCIYGESGTGKELIARAIHLASPRAQRPLVTLDCAAIPDGLMESQLFGHVKGAFTGAVDNRDGVFGLAHTGTLFMDELSEIDFSMQSKLLRVIQTREFFKVGSSRPLSTNIRIVAATNKDLKQAVDDGSFREDLYYRVAVIMIKVPPLRERRDDIPMLVEHFLQNFSQKYRKRIRGIDAGAMDRIVSSPWPGNVRQLQNFLEQAVVLSDREMLRERDLFLGEAPPVRGGIVKTFEMEPGLPLNEIERLYILRTLARLDGSRTQTAKMLGISLRALQYKLKAYMEADGRLEPTVVKMRRGRDRRASASMEQS